MKKFLALLLLFSALITQAQESFFRGNNNFVAPTLTVPTLAATTAASSITRYSASSGGSILSNGGSTILESGICWGTSTPTISNNKTTDGGSIGNFTSTLSGLTAGITYYVRAYATNSAGTSYGSVQTFTTTPTVIIPAIGASYGGGVVGYVYQNGDRGFTSTNIPILITSTTPQGLTRWFNGSSIATGATASILGSGFANTNTIITSQGASTGGLVYAAALARNYTGGGFTDWYLPSQDELNKLYINRTEIGGYTNAYNYFWASTEVNASSAKLQNFLSGGAVLDFGKNATGGTVRAVRTIALSPKITPIITTSTSSGITATEASITSSVTDEGLTQVSSRGFVYGTTTGSSTFSVTNGSGAGSYTSTLSGLTSATTYYVRSFATNTQGTAYGAEISFTTATTPSISVTATPSSLTTTSAVGGATISSTGGATITTSGLVWDTSSNPTVAVSTKTTDGATTGTFTSSITGLTQGTTYHVRAYATNIVGTSYGPDITFTTLTTPTVSATASVSSITGTTATTGGTISFDGGASITARGIVYGTSTNSYTYTVTTGTGTGTYTSSLTGLSNGTTYYLRAYASNSVGTVYGPSEVSFTTLSIATLASTTTSTITSSTAILGGVLSSTGGATTAIGIMYSADVNFGTSSTTTISSNGNIGTYTTTVTNLAASTNYYVKSFATNSAGTSYGPQVSFTTSAPPITLGSTYGGGFVFYIFQSNEAGYVSGETHGLIAETRDQTTDNPNDRDNDRTNWSTWDNSLSLIADPNNHSTAGKLYSDWRLATSDELNILYTQLFSQTALASLASYKSSFNRNFYWSSSIPVGNLTVACTQGLAGGGSRYCDTNKSSVKLPVRSIRSF